MQHEYSADSTHSYSHGTSCVEYPSDDDDMPELFHPPTPGKFFPLDHVWTAMAHSHISPDWRDYTSDEEAGPQLFHPPTP